MSYLTIGINHKTAPVSIREQLVFPQESLVDALTDMVKRSCVQEGAILSTCNRTELYCKTSHSDPKTVINWLSDFHQLEVKAIEPYLYTHPDEHSVRHLLKVASGLDSMVFGEPQILGQVKSAYQSARLAGTTGKYLDKLFQHTFSVAKQIRTDTAIGSSPVSVAFAAVRLAQQVFGDLKNQTALLIGAGETIELTANHLVQQGIGQIIIANRTLDKARVLAEQFHGQALLLKDIPEVLHQADVLISSTASQLPIIGKGLMEQAIKKRKHKPMFIVDIAVPRDIEPQIHEMDDVYLYTVDDLHEIIDRNIKSRKKAALQAGEIIDTQVKHFQDWLKSLEGVSIIREYRENSQGIRDQVLAEAVRRLKNQQDPEETLQWLAHRLTNKITHKTTVKLREASVHDHTELLKLAKDLL